MKAKTATFERRQPTQSQTLAAFRDLGRQAVGRRTGAELRAASTNEMLAFYDTLLPVYDRLFPDWPALVRQQNKLLRRLIEQKFGAAQGLRIMDPTSGIGTQAIAVAQLGHKIFAMDVCRKALVRSKAEAAKLNLAIHYAVADMRDLRCFSGRVFDLAISMGNSLCVFQTEEDLVCALRQVHRVIRPGGYFFVGIRDYRQAIASRSSFDGPMCCVDAGRHRMAHQMWIWLDDRRYQVNVYIDQQVSANRWKSQVFRSDCRAILPGEIERALRIAGFSSIEWPVGSTQTTPKNATDHGFDELVVIARC